MEYLQNALPSFIDHKFTHLSYQDNMTLKECCNQIELLRYRVESLGKSLSVHDTIRDAYLLDLPISDECEIKNNFMLWSRLKFSSQEQLYLQIFMRLICLRMQDTQLDAHQEVECIVKAFQGELHTSINDILDELLAHNPSSAFQIRLNSVLQTLDNKYEFEQSDTLQTAIKCNVISQKTEQSTEQSTEQTTATQKNKRNNFNLVIRKLKLPLQENRFPVPEPRKQVKVTRTFGVGINKTFNLVSLNYTKKIINEPVMHTYKENQRYNERELCLIVADKLRIIKYNQNKDLQDYQEILAYDSD